MSLKKLIPAILLALCLCFSAALAYDAPDVRAFATLALAGVDLEAIVTELPETPLIEDGLITMPDAAYDDVFVIVAETGEMIRGALEDGLWRLDCAGVDLSSRWTYLIAEAYPRSGTDELPPTPGRSCAWYMTGLLNYVTFTYPGGLPDSGLTEVTVFLTGRDQVYFIDAVNGDVSMRYDENGALTGYHYSIGDDLSVHFDARDNLPFLVTDGSDPVGYPSLEIVSE